MSIAPAPHIAASVAAACAVAALLIVVLVGRRTWMQWRRTQATQHAAAALVDMHLARLETTANSVSAHGMQLADRMPDITVLMHALRADVAHLRWLLRQVPEAKERLREALLALFMVGAADRNVRGSAR